MTVARAAGSATSHNNKIFDLLHHHRSGLSGPRPARPVSAWLSTLQTVIIIQPNPAQSGGGHLWPGILPDEDLDTQTLGVQSYLSSLIIAPCPVIVRLSAGSCHKSDT